MAKSNAKLLRNEIASMTRRPKLRTREEKRAAVERATRGLRVGVQVTPRLYGRG